jgi:BASS family bile acid:Na+ symporter
MQGSLLSEVVLPLVLFVVMLGMGLSLVPDDFRRVGQYPKALVIGIVCQMIVLPLIGLGVIQLIPLTPALAVGLMVLAFSPGGVTSNMFTYLSRGDLALSITLTALVSLVTPFTIPVLTNMALADRMGETAHIALPVVKTVIVLIAITLVPVAIGMLVNAKKPALAKRSEKVVKVVSLVALFVIIGALVAKEWSQLPDWFAKVGLACLLLNALSMAAGYGVALLTKLERPQAITIGLEVGIQNGTTALFVTSTLLDDPEMSISPAIYSLIMFATAAAFGYLVNLGRKAS